VSFGNDIEVIEMLSEGGKGEIKSGIDTPEHLDRALLYDKFWNWVGVDIWLLS
jgi:hypothetical protein